MHFLAIINSFNHLQSTVLCESTLSLYVREFQFFNLKSYTECKFFSSVNRNISKQSILQENPRVLSVMQVSHISKILDHVENCF